MNPSPAELRKGALILLVCAAVCFLPYLVPVPPTVSRSYVAGFSNRAAVLLLIAGTWLVALLTRGEIATPGTKDSRLSASLLAAGCGFTLLVCLFRLKLSADGFLGGETSYFLNRQQMLAAGLVPYRGFEFVYGPVLLYPTLWVTRLFHCTALHGYDIVWFLNWLLGAAMVWVVVRAIDLPMPSRGLVFAFLLVSQLIWTDFGGLNYTPLRAYAAAFFVVVSHALWVRSGSPWMLAFASVASVAVALAISVEQAISVAFGLLAHMALLLVFSRPRFSLAALGSAVAGIAVCFGVAWRLGSFISFQGFASGGYCYPLLPSFSILLALLAYIVAGCVLYRSVRGGRLRSVNVPLVLAGCALLPVALGRCDLLHIGAASPAFAVGIAGLFSARMRRRTWIGLAFLGLILIPFGLRRGGRFWKHVLPEHVAASRVAAQPLSPEPVTDQEAVDRYVNNQYYVSEVSLTAAQLPCDRTYFSPSFMPVPTQPMQPRCWDSGYYEGLVDVITPERIREKIEEMRRRPEEPLILENMSLRSQFPTELADLDSLKRDAGSFWVPSPRHAPVRYAPIGDYIAAHYIAGKTFADGTMRIWEPISQARQ